MDADGQAVMPDVQRFVSVTVPVVRWFEASVSEHVLVHVATSVSVAPLLQ